MKGKWKINAFSYSQEALLNEKALSKFQIAPLTIEICALKRADLHLWCLMLENSKGILNDTLDASNWTLVEMVGECFLMFPLFIVRFGVLRQGP